MAQVYDDEYHKGIAIEVLKKHKKHKASNKLLAAFLFLLEEGRVDWEINDDDEVEWFLTDK